MTGGDDARLISSNDNGMAAAAAAAAAAVAVAESEADNGIVDGNGGHGAIVLNVFILGMCSATVRAKVSISVLVDTFCSCRRPLLLLLLPPRASSSLLVAVRL